MKETIIIYRSKYEKIFLLTLLSCIVLLLPDLALAEAWDTTANQIQDILSGPFFRTVATIAIMVVGYMAFTGRMNWRWAGSIIGGIVLVVAAPSIVDLIAGAAGS